MVVTEVFRTIAGSFWRGEVGLLVGAGMSAESHVALGSTIARRMLRRAVLGEQQEDVPNPVIDALAVQYPFEAIAEFLKEKVAYQDIAGWLNAQGGLADAKPSKAHCLLRDLYGLVPARFPKIIFTTNFDTLIEDAFESEAVCVTSVNLRELVKARESGKIAVVHLHGAVTHPDSIIAGEAALLDAEGPLFDLLRGALSTDIFVLMGYSLADTNLRSVFFDVQRVSKTRQGLQKRTFAVSPADGEFTDGASAASIARVMWKQRGVEHIPVTAGEFMASLYEATHNFIQFEMRQRVAEALGKTPATLDNLLETAARPFGVIEPQDLLVYLYYSLTSLGRKS
jgi:SIR2-like domain